MGGVRVGKLWCLAIGSLEPFTDSGIDVTGVPADEQPTTEFAAFVLAHERTLRQSLSAALGLEPAREATAEALAYGWEHWDRVGAMDNPAGYSYRVGLHWGTR